MTLRVAVVIAILAGTGLFTHRALESAPVTLRAPLENFPSRLGDWQSDRSYPLDSDVLKVLKLDDYLNRVYQKPDSAVSLYIGYYQTQRTGGTAHSPMNCLPGNGWQPIRVDRVKLPGFASDGRQPDINRYVVQKGLERQVVLFWYQSHGRVLASEYASRFFLMADAITLNRTDGALVRVLSPVAGSDQQSEQVAFERAVDFIRVALPALGQFLPS